MHMHIVKSCARKIFLNLPNGSVDEEDLISEGVIALVKAAKEFNPSKNSTFPAYIKLKASGAMKDYLRKLDILSQQKRKQVKDFQKDLANLEASLGKTPSEHEILRNLNLTKKQYSEIINNINISSSLYIDSYEYDFLDSFLSSDSLDSAQDNITEALSEAISTLSEREQLILQLHFYEDLSFKEISAILEISNVRISQIYSKSLLKLKERVKSILNED